MFVFTGPKCTLDSIVLNPHLFLTLTRLRQMCSANYFCRELYITAILVILHICGSADCTESRGVLGLSPNPKAVVV